MNVDVERMRHRLADLRARSSALIDQGDVPGLAEVVDELARTIELLLRAIDVAQSES